jgi:ubiquinol-cytochrome c reductase cytochrome c1 subunit
MARKQVGFVGVLMLTILSVLLYLTNKRIWASAKGKEEA